MLYFCVILCLLLYLIVVFVRCCGMVFVVLLCHYVMWYALFVVDVLFPYFYFISILSVAFLGQGPFEK